MKSVALIATMLAWFAQLAWADTSMDWSGDYSYTAHAGSDAMGAGPEMFVDYHLSLTPHTCSLEADGYQTQESIRCQLQPHGNIADIVFVSYADGTTKNLYGVEVYKVGNVLLSLKVTGSTLMTRWQHYTPVELYPENVMIRFVKKRPKP